MELDLIDAGPEVQIGERFCGTSVYGSPLLPPQPYIPLTTDLVEKWRSILKRNEMGSALRMGRDSSFGEESVMGDLFEKEGLPDITSERVVECIKEIPTHY